MRWKQSVVLVTGASRGIGAAFSKRVASLGARVVLTARSLDRPLHESLTGSLNDVCAEIEADGGQALARALDTRDAARIGDIVDEIGQRWGRLDLLVNNASAIDLRRYPPTKAADLMHAVNARGTMLLNAACSPLLAQTDGQILTISPPVGADAAAWARVAPPYAASKYGMTLNTLGLSDEVKANCLWPARTIATAATRMLESRTGVEYHTRGRRAEYFARAMVAMVERDETGCALLDEDVLPHPEDDAPVDMFVGPPPPPAAEAA